MRTLIVIGAIALIGSLNVQAQTKPSPVDKAWVALNTEQLNVQLGLDDVQQAKVKDIDNRYVTKHQGLEEAKLTEKEMSDRTAVLMTERDRELRLVLTTAQYDKWDAMRQKGTGDLTPEKKEKMK
ncbi:MAG: hypothetical protein ABI599_07925 [Flavobacteriales bacterium]